MQKLIASEVRAPDSDMCLGKQQLVYHSVEVDAALAAKDAQLLAAEARERELRQALERVQSIINGTTARHCGMHMIHSVQIDTSVVGQINQALAAPPLSRNTNTPGLERT